MQSQEPNTRSADAVSHPDSAEWMSYLYGEIAPEKKRELRKHLDQCPVCERQINRWRQSMEALDDWALPALPRARATSYAMPILKWAAAAVVILTAGFAIGRQTSNASSEIAVLKSTVAQLTQKIDANPLLNSTNASASEEFSQLLADYSQLQNEQRTEDRKTVALALRDFDLRLIKLRAELETVAVNTESGFRQTQDGLTQLASYTATGNGAPEITKPETNHQ